MQAIILFVVMALTVSTFSVLTKTEIKLPQMTASLVETQETSQAEEAKEEVEETAPQAKTAVVSQPTKTAVKYVSQPVQQTKKEEPQVPLSLIDTYIKYGPKNNEIIDETNEVTFQFGAVLKSQETEGKIIFETKVEGLEETWKETYDQERTVTFPNGTKEYTFLVRAKIKNTNIIDYTPAKRTFQINISPYFGKVEFYKVEVPGAKANPSLIKLTTKVAEGEKIDITGWQVKAKYGDFYLPQGVEVYLPQVAVRQSQDIVIKKGDIIYISSQANPFGGKNWNFRTNKCMGYLTNSYDFPVTISKNCPRISQSEIPLYLERCCREYILSLDKCEEYTTEGAEEYDLLKDSQCTGYITSRFNYAGCYAYHSQDTDFLGNEWHIYSNRTEREIMADGCDTIYLYDKNGLLVDKYDYGTVTCKK